MSIVTLKRKSRRYQAPLSGQDKGGFSINGGYRSQGWVGQDMRGRYLSHTPFRGVAPIGNGGCCGRYVENIISNGNCCEKTNDPSIVKRSAMNTRGYIDTRVEYPTVVFNPYCEGKDCNTIWVKDFNPLNHSQSTYIDNLKVKSACVLDASNSGIKVCKPDACGPLSYFIGGTKHFTARYSKGPTGAISSGEHTAIGFLRNQCLPTPFCKAPFPMVLNSHGCASTYLFPEEAIAAGLLPHDWGSCIPGTKTGHGPYIPTRFTNDFTFDAEAYNLVGLRYDTKFGWDLLGPVAPHPVGLHANAKSIPNVEIGGFSLFLNDNTGSGSTKNGYGWTNAAYSYPIHGTGDPCEFYKGNLPLVGQVGNSTSGEVPVGPGKIGTAVPGGSTFDNAVQQVMTAKFTDTAATPGPLTVPGNLLLSVSGLGLPAGVFGMTFTGLTTTSSAGGNGAILTVAVSTGSVWTITVTTAGTGYSVNETLTVSAAQIFPANHDLVFTLQGSDLSLQVPMEWGRLEIAVENIEVEAPTFFFPYLSFENATVGLSYTGPASSFTKSGYYGTSLKFIDVLTGDAETVTLEDLFVEDAGNQFYYMMANQAAPSTPAGYPTFGVDREQGPVTCGLVASWGPQRRNNFPFHPVFLTLNFINPDKPLYDQIDATYVPYGGRDPNPPFHTPTYYPYKKMWDKFLKIHGWMTNGKRIKLQTCYNPYYPTPPTSAWVCPLNP